MTYLTVCRTRVVHYRHILLLRGHLLKLLMYFLRLFYLKVRIAYLIRYVFS